jgi:hypothetical protein
MTDILPPANPNALGLHVTDEEWRLLLELLAAEPTIIEARVYGSRQTGFRREKPEPKPLDLDIAITVRSGDPDDRVLEFCRGDCP